MCVAAIAFRIVDVVAGWQLTIISLAGCGLFLGRVERTMQANGRCGAGACQAAPNRRLLAGALRAVQQSPVRLDAFEQLLEWSHPAHLSGQWAVLMQ